MAPHAGIVREPETPAGQDKGATKGPSSEPILLPSDGERGVCAARAWPALCDMPKTLGGACCRRSSPPAHVLAAGSTRSKEEEGPCQEGLHVALKQALQSGLQGGSSGKGTSARKAAGAPSRARQQGEQGPPAAQPGRAVSKKQKPSKASKVRVHDMTGVVQYPAICDILAQLQGSLCPEQGCMLRHGI